MIKLGVKITRKISENYLYEVILRNPILLWTYTFKSILEY